LINSEKNNLLWSLSAMHYQAGLVGEKRLGEQKNLYFEKARDTLIWRLATDLGYRGGETSFDSIKAFVLAKRGGDEEKG
jgi:hypothetical protein